MAQRIRALVPELDDLNLRRRLPVKDNTYDAMLTDMNERQIARLDASQIAVFNRVFREHRSALDYFGYDLMGGEAGGGGWTRSEVEKLQGFPRRHEPAVRPAGVQALQKARHMDVTRLQQRFGVCGERLSWRSTGNPKKARSATPPGG